MPERAAATISPPESTKPPNLAYNRPLEENIRSLTGSSSPIILPVDGLIEGKREELGKVCERHGVSRLDLFGSAAGEGFDPESSDMDFVVSFAPRTPARLFDRYFGLKEDLEHLFGREVDLLMEGAMKNPYFVRSVNESRVPLYAA